MVDTQKEITGPINIGNPDEYTIRDLAELIIELTGTKAKIMFEKLPADDPRQRQPDISKARELFGWEPKTMLRAGLMKTITYYDRLLSEDTVPALGSRRTGT